MEDDKSTAGSEQDTNFDEPDVELEDIEVSEEDIAGIEKDEDDESEPEVKPEEVKPEVESEQPEVEDKPEEDETKDEPVQDEQSSKSDEERRAYNKQMAEQRIREKQTRDAEIRQKQQAYVAEAEDDQSLALRQLQVDAYNNKVENNTNKLQNGYERAVKDFPILADSTPEIKAEIDAAIDAFQAMYVTLDSFGNPSEVRGDLYKYLQTKSDSIQRLTQIGARKQVDSKAKEKSKTTIVPSRTPKEPKKDEDLEAFWAEAKK